MRPRLIAVRKETKDLLSTAKKPLLNFEFKLDTFEFLERQ